MAQYSFTKSAGGFLVPCTPDTKEYVDTKLKLGAIVTAVFKLVRNPAFHRKFFALLNLGFEYWEPVGGSVSPFERQFLRGYIKRVANYVGHKEILLEFEDEYLQLISDKRAANISAAKSFHAFRRWVTVEAGHYDLLQMPDGSAVKEPRSISFAKMEELEFNDLYKAALNVLWTFILSRSFKTKEEAEQVAYQLMGYAA